MQVEALESKSQDPLYWVNPDEPEAAEKNSLLFSGELSGSSIVVTVSGVASKFFKSNIFFSLFVEAACYLATKLVKKLFGGYTPVASFEREAIKITRNVPYILCLATCLAILFAKHLPVLSISCACVGGILAGITYDVKTVAQSYN